MTSTPREPADYGRERLAARAAKYRCEVARLRDLCRPNDDDQTTEETEDA